MRRLTLTIRTADRALTRSLNYLGRTVRRLVAAGVAPADIHLVPTAPDVAWLEAELGALALPVHVPAVRRLPNDNGVAQVAVLDLAPADWLLMLEDDVLVCADFAGSVERWLAQHARPDVHVYRFCAFGRVERTGPGGDWYPLREQRGAQAIALRADDARGLAAWWAARRGTNWRPKYAPFQQDRDRGFDKLVGYWALSTWPDQRFSLVSRPHFVRHIGLRSSLHRGTVTNDAAFAGESYAYAGGA